MRCRRRKAAIAMVVFCMLGVCYITIPWILERHNTIPQTMLQEEKSEDTYERHIKVISSQETVSDDVVAQEHDDINITTTLDKHKTKTDDLKIKFKTFKSENEVNEHNSMSIKYYSKSTKSCQPKTKVCFLKVHKTGSTTFQKILQHYGKLHNSTFVVPITGSHFHKYKTISRANMQLKGLSKTPDILADHAVYNHDAFKQLLPSDMIYVTIVREPISWFISSFLFWRYDKRIERKLRIYNKSIVHYIDEYIKNPQRFEGKKPIWHAIHRFPYDFGIPAFKLRDTQFVRDYTRDVLDKDFKVVLVNEYYDESLLLFKRYMCWHIKDIFHNNYKVDKKATHHELSRRLRILHEMLNPASYIIYNHFLERFKAEVTQQGEDFQQELALFKRHAKTVANFCKQTTKSTAWKLHLSSKWDGDFTVSRNECRMINNQTLYAPGLE